MSPAPKKSGGVGLGLLSWLCRRIRRIRLSSHSHFDVPTGPDAPAPTRPAAAPRVSFLDLPTEVRLKIYQYLLADLTAELTDNLFANFSVYDHTYDLTPSHKQPCQWTSQSACPRVLQTTWMCRDHRDAIHALERPRWYGPKPQLLRFFGVDRFELASIQHPAFKEAIDRANANAHAPLPGTGLTAMLLVSRALHAEALEVLCQHAELVVTVKGGRDIDGHKRRALRRLDGLGPHLPLAGRLKLNVSPNRVASPDETTGRQTSPHDPAGTLERLVARLAAVLDAIAHGSRLRSLQVFIDGACGQLLPGSAGRVLDVLQEGLATRSNKDLFPVRIYLGDISSEIITEERMEVLVDAIHGKDMGRGHKALVPKRYRYAGNITSRSMWRI